MKHIAIRSKSVGDPTKPFTAPGLGDRIHIVTTGWCYNQVHNVPVTLHLTRDKLNKNKANSFNEILGLFPNNCIFIQAHDVEMLNEDDWINYLSTKGIDAEIYCYRDHLGWYESIEKLDISKYLKNIPRLIPEDISHELKLPEKFVTSQWDSSGISRKIEESSRQAILDLYSFQGYEIVTVGGDSDNLLLRNSLKHIAFAISKAEFHVGIDSGFMHFAQLFKDPSLIHLYKEPKGMWSHHLLRACDNGSPLNLYYKKISAFDRIIRYLVYDNHMLIKYIKNHTLTKRVIYDSKLIRKLLTEGF